MISRRQFLQFAAAPAVLRLKADATDAQRTGKPRGHEFVFARLRYEWRNKRFLREDNTKFAVNIAVYLMT